MKNALKAIALAAVVSLASATAFAQDEPAKPAHQHMQLMSTSLFSQFMDTSNWNEGTANMKPGEVVELNPAKPGQFAKILAPDEHVRVHMSLTNPEHYAQYMTPQFMMQFMNPQTYVEMVSAENIDPFAKQLTSQKTMQFWMQPGAYMHAMSPEGYMQMVNPASYMKLATAVMNSWADPKWYGNNNPFNPFAWMNMMTPGNSNPSGQPKQ